VFRVGVAPAIVPRGTSQSLHRPWEQAAWLLGDGCRLNAGRTRELIRPQKPASKPVKRRAKAYAGEGASHGLGMVRRADPYEQVVDQALGPDGPDLTAAEEQENV